jgi:hypothetical protein
MIPESVVAVAACEYMHAARIQNSSMRRDLSPHRTEIPPYEEFIEEIDVEMEPRDVELEEITEDRNSNRFAIPSIP